MILTNRILFDDNGTLTDHSKNLNNFHSGTSTLVWASATDELYVGSELKFNHRWFEVSTANSNAASLSVSLWDGDSWVAAQDIIDYTKPSTATLAQSGIIQWTKDPDESWNRDDTDEMTGSGLENLNIYGLYWLKITASADLSGSTALKYVGHRFSSDEDLGSLYPELTLSDTMTQFAAGKTNWNEQHFEAANQIIRMLKKREEIVSGDQILDHMMFSEVAVHIVACIAFNAFGDDFKDQYERSKKLADDALNMINFRTDKNNNARLDLSEIFPSFGVYRR